MQLDQPSALRLLIRPRAQSTGQGDSLEEVDVRELQTGAVANVVDPLLPSGEALYYLDRSDVTAASFPDTIAALGGGLWVQAQAASALLVDEFGDFTDPSLALNGTVQTAVTLNVVNPLAVPLVCALAWCVGVRSVAGAPGIARVVLQVDGSPFPVQGNAQAVCRPGGPATPGSADASVGGVSRVTLPPGPHVVTLGVQGVDFGSGNNTLAIPGAPTGGGSTYLWLHG